jgi:YggT family protein
VIAEIISVTIFILTLAIIARPLLSWFPIDPRNPIAEFLYTVTEPILAPLRQVVPRLGMFDLTPLVAILLLQFLGRIVVSGLQS